MAKSLNAKGSLGKASQMPSQVSMQKSCPSTKPAKGQHKGAMIMGPFGGRKSA